MDLVRGFFLVCIMMNHTLAIVNAASYNAYPTWVLVMLLTGTIGFTTVSGMLIGYFLITKASDLPRIFARYRVQALRLFFIAHPLMALALFLPSHVSFTTQLVSAWYITDTLAILFFFVVPHMPRMAPNARLLLGAILIVAGRVAFLAAPKSQALVLLKDILAGPDMNGAHVLHSDYALLPISGAFFVGSFIGHHYAIAEREDRMRAFTARVWRVVACLPVLSAAEIGVWALAKLLRPTVPGVRLFFYPDYFFSLYPYYVAVTLAIMLIFVNRRRIGKVAEFFIVFGKTSLFTYVVHYYFVLTLPELFGLIGTPSLWATLAYGVAVIVFLNWVARFYNTYYKKS